MNLLKLKVSNCEKYALVLMDALFTDEEMASSCYMKTDRSKKPPLPQDKITLLTSNEVRKICEIYREFEEGSMLIPEIAKF